jgi:hypothetical protein
MNVVGFPLCARSVSLLGPRSSALRDPDGGIDSPAVSDAFSFRMLLAALVGWLDQRQQDAVAYLIEEPHPAWAPTRPAPPD